MRAVFFITFLALTGCATNLYFHGKEIDKSLSTPEVVFVTNPDHNNYEVLKRSEIYILSTDPNTREKLTLIDTEILPKCGVPLLGAIYTLGILPGYIDASEVFFYKIETNGSSKVYQHQLEMHETMSNWEWFAKPFKNDIDTKAKALRNSERLLEIPK